LALDSATGIIAGQASLAGTFGPYIFQVQDVSGSSADSQEITLRVLGTTADECAPRGNESALTTATPYAFLLQGFDATGQGFATAGSFTPGGDGTIASAEADYNGYALAGSSPRRGSGHFSVDLAGCSYALGADGRGCLVLSFTDSLPAAAGDRILPKAQSKGGRLKAHSLAFVTNGSQIYAITQAAGSAAQLIIFDQGNLP
jgi:hypothetical protein